MYLSAPDFTLEDFVQACNLIAPQGTSIDMIISPKQLGLPQGTGFTPVEHLNDIPEDDSITYTRTEPILKQSSAQTPGDYSIWNVDELKRTIPTPNQTPPVTDTATLKSPFVRELSESTLFGKDVILQEDWACFPKNTLFNIKREKLREKFKIVIITDDKHCKVLHETDTKLNAIKYLHEYKNMNPKANAKIIKN